MTRLRSEGSKGAKRFRRFRRLWWAALPPVLKNFKTRLRPREMRPPFGGWRHHLPPVSGGTIKPYNRAVARGKTSQTRFARWKTVQPPLRAREMHPFCLRHLPWRGGLLYLSLSANLGGADIFLDHSGSTYIIPKLSLYSTGLMPPKVILIRSSLYQ